MNTMHRTRQWYIAAVKSALILKGVEEREAIRGIRKYRLRQRFDRNPEQQLHDDVRDIADSIICRGLCKIHE